MAGSQELPIVVCLLSRWLSLGEPVEKLFLWGHSACTLDNQLLVFGGFGRHAHRNYSLLLDPISVTLKAYDLEGVPSPRFGHTSCLVGDRMFIIEGRADPERTLSDVWVLYTTKNECKLLECFGNAFPPRFVFATFLIRSIIVHLFCNKAISFSKLNPFKTQTS